MLTKENAIPGTTVIFEGIRETIILSGNYQDEELGLMIKTAAFPGGMPASKFTFPIDPDRATDSHPAVIDKNAPIVIFKGKLQGDTEDTIITPALIEEKSKPLLALKINGIFDTEGMEAVKSAKLKAVKMRTLVEKQADPVMKAINAKAKEDVAKVKAIAEPIYAACKKTEDAMQLVLDNWQTDVNKAKQVESDALKAKTEGRDNKIFELGLTWNGQQFVGYGKVITKEYLYGLPEIRYFELVGELEGLQMEQSVTGEVKAAPVVTPPTGPTTCYGGGSTVISTPQAGTNIPKREYITAVYDKTLPAGTRIVLTRGEIPNPEDGAKIINDRVQNSAIYVQVI